MVYERDCSFSATIDQMQSVSCCNCKASRGDYDPNNGGVALLCSDLHVNKADMANQTNVRVFALNFKAESKAVKNLGLIPCHLISVNVNYRKYSFPKRLFYFTRSLVTRAA
jgi:hypothetical protein